MKKKTYVAIFASLCIVLIALCSIAFRKESDSFTRVNAQSSSTKIDLSDYQKHHGALILVNHNYSCQVGRPKLRNIASHRSFPYAIKDNTISLAPVALRNINAMLKDCSTSVDENMGISSAYRDFEYQRMLYDKDSMEKGVAHAKSYVALPGHSEHHTGYAADLAVYRPGGGALNFEETETYKWIYKHCQDYGFIKRYSADKSELTGINEESWHFRYVGIPHATYMKNHELCLEEYLAYLKENTSADKALCIPCKKHTYKVFYTSSDSVLIPTHTKYTISGDNIDGYIITLIS